MTIESPQSRIMKMVGRYTFKTAFKDHLSVEILRKGDIKRPEEKQLTHCSIEELEISGCRTIRLTPETVNQDKIIFYIHGGGYVSGPYIYHWNMLVKTDWN